MVDITARLYILEYGIYIYMYIYIYIYITAPVLYIYWKMVYIADQVCFGWSGREMLNSVWFSIIFTDKLLSVNYYICDKIIIII